MICKLNVFCGNRCIYYGRDDKHDRYHQQTREYVVNMYKKANPRLLYDMEHDS